MSRLCATFLSISSFSHSSNVGCEKQIETPNGKIKIKIPKMTSSGKKLRLKGLGLTKKDNSKGDLEARIKIVLPQDISKEALGFYEKLKKLNS